MCEACRDGKRAKAGFFMDPKFPVSWISFQQSLTPPQSPSASSLFAFYAYGSSHYNLRVSVSSRFQVSIVMRCLLLFISGGNIDDPTISVLQAGGELARP